jgi:hypothetical protein
MDSGNATDHLLLCPSYIAKPGAKLFGIADQNGEVNYLTTTITIDKTFVEVAKKGRKPEERFRFAGKCIQNGCSHWTENHCGLLAKVIDTINKVPGTSIQNCPIRNSCRWYAQEKELACANCSEIFRNSEKMFLQSP